MKNPYHLALGVLSWAGVAALLISWLVYLFANDAYGSDAARTALTAQAFMWTAAGWTLLAFVAWLIVGALTWKAPVPVDANVEA